ncbi:MAG: putative ABC-type exoprotein transport system permease subunit [Polaribacter sp.]
MIENNKQKNMDNNLSKHSRKAFRYSLISIILFVSIVFWLVISMEKLKLGSSIGGGVSGVIGIFFFIFNYKGLTNTYKGFKNDESFSLIAKIVVCGNVLLSIFPLALILLVTFGLLGVDTFEYFAPNVK